VSGRNFTYSGSDTISEVGWTLENSSDGRKAVGIKAANELGIYDMSGNVWEWCWDVKYTSSRSIRGGSWDFGADYAAVANRTNGGRPGDWYIGSGFRLARNPGN
jgi:formylglycine-generating enzyme required for sulfatase activity